MAQYGLLVSHGTLAYGVLADLEMLAGKRDDLIAVCLEDGMGQDAFAEKLLQACAHITPDDEVFVFADIIGGSPLTTTLAKLSERGILEHLYAIGGLNLPMVLAATTMGFDDGLTGTALVSTVLDAAREAIYEFKIDKHASTNAEADEDEDDI